MFLKQNNIIKMFFVLLFFYKKQYFLKNVDEFYFIFNIKDNKSLN